MPKLQERTSNGAFSLSQQEISPDQQESVSEVQRRKLRWFFAWLYAIALLSSIIAGVIIALVTRNPLPTLVPSALLFAMSPMIRWVYPNNHK